MKRLRKEIARIRQQLLLPDDNTGALVEHQDTST